MERFSSNAPFTPVPTLDSHRRASIRATSRSLPNGARSRAPFQWTCGRGVGRLAEARGAGRGITRRHQLHPGPPPAVRSTGGEAPPGHHHRDRSRHDELVRSRRVRRRAGEAHPVQGGRLHHSVDLRGGRQGKRAHRPRGEAPVAAQPAEHALRDEAAHRPGAEGRRRRDGAAVGPVPRPPRHRERRRHRLSRAHLPRPRDQLEDPREDPRRRLRPPRSEEHTSELQSRENLVCRLLLEKKKNIIPALYSDGEVSPQKGKQRLYPTRPAIRRYFFFNDTATTEIYTLSLHDALPIC